MGLTHSSRDGIIKDLSQLDQSLLIPKGDTADDGPNTGDAGEQEAVMADEQKSKGSPTKRAHVRDLVERLVQAVPSTAPTEALAWLGELTRGFDPTWAGKLKLGQFASDELVRAVNESLADNGDDVDPTGLMEEEFQDDEDEDVTDASGDELSVDEDVSDGLEPWKQQLLELLVPARQARGHDAQIDAADDLAEVLHSTAFVLYRKQGLPDEVIAARLAQRRNGSVVTGSECEADKVAHREAWFFRTAFWMVSSDVNPVDLLREFELPVLKRQRSSVDHVEPSDDVTSHSADAASEDSDSQAEVGTEVSDRAGEADGEQASDSGDAGSTDVEGQPSAGDSDRRFVVSSDGKVDDVERQIVDSRDLPTRRGDKTPPKPKAEDGQGEAAAATGDKPKQASPPPTDRSTSGSDAEPRQKSDESILANLPDDVIKAAIQAVIDDDDPKQAWAYRSPETVRSEADRRLLLEYGQHAAA